MSRQACTRSGCSGGTIDDDGYCDTCGMAPEKKGAPAQWAPPIQSQRRPTEATEAIPGRTRAGPSGAQSAGTTRRSTRVTLGKGLVALPTVTRVDPKSRLQDNLTIPETKRYCVNGHPVGRSRTPGTPGLDRGFCPTCQEPFNFRPKLEPGDMVAGQYEVAGCLAHGGLGWIHLAIDRNVADRWVVLKGTVGAGDSSSEELALAERRFLAEAKHPNIVDIHNFVEHRGERFIVMEYVNGESLRAMLEARNATEGPWEPMPVEQAIGFVLEILPALSHLHDQGLIYCDLKPDNIMVGDSSVKLIDLGAVYRLAEPAQNVYGTAGYQAPEIATRGPSVASDIFTVGRTLAVLCADLRGSSTVLPPASTVPVFAANDSFYRVLARATALDPDDRFASIDELADQLEGVLREIVAAQTGIPRPTTSHSFTGELTPDLDGPAWTSMPSLLVDPGDPMAGYLAAIRAVDGEEVLEQLDRLPEQTPEVQLRRVISLIGLGRVTEADVVLADLRAGGLADWRLDWYAGLGRLAAGDGAGATECLLRVYSKLPGEAAPKVGLGVAAEQAGNHPGACGWYRVVAQTDPSYTAAVFGLARAQAALGDVAAAAAVLAAVQPTSGSHGDAQVKRAALLVDAAGQPNADGPTVLAGVRAAEALRVGLPQRAELLAAALEHALRAVRNGVGPDESATVAGEPFDEPGIRRALEAIYRALAKRAPTLDQRVALVDRANRVRPRSLT